MKLFDFVFQATGGQTLPIKVWRKITAGSVVLRMPDDVEWVFVRMIGGGGAGGDARYHQIGVGGGGGGGAGIYVELVHPVQPGGTYPCVVGGGGGNSSFGEGIAKGGRKGGDGRQNLIPGLGGGCGNDGLPGVPNQETGGTGGYGEIPAMSFCLGEYVCGSGGAGNTPDRRTPSSFKGQAGKAGFVEIVYRSAGEITEV